MAIVLAVKSGRVNSDIREYFLDTDDEVDGLPKNPNSGGYICTGSNAYVVTTGNVYMFSSKNNEWVKQS